MFLTTRNVLHHEYVVNSVYVSVLNLEHSVNFCDKSSRVFPEMLVKLLKLLKQSYKLFLGYCLQNIPIVFAEEEKFSTSSPTIVAHDPIQFVTVFFQVKALVNPRYAVLVKQMLENLRRIDCELSVQKREPWQEKSFLLVVIEPFRVDSEADLLLIV
jgi:hypothetical protein